MSRKRLTARDSESKIVAEVEQLEQMLEAGMDEELVQDAQELANREVSIVENSAVEPISENVKQNERFQKNWPMSESERKTLATSLVAMAKRLIVTEK